ncbi:MAG: hypothetical protein Q7S40_05735 [Opitutaceae bacterium]|nr:hypothetical protein [Opitutaceae bacterium]
MKKLTSRLAWLVIALVVAGAFVVPAVHAAEKTAEQKSEGKKKKDAEDLQKYDKNKNGVLDPDEKAEMKADQEKAKRKKNKG